MRLLVMLITFSTCFVDLGDSRGLTEHLRSARHRRSPWTSSGIPIQRYPHYGGSSSNEFWGTTFGDDNIITFDGRYYNFPDNSARMCPHVLARDHESYNFVLIMRRQSITVYTAGTVVTLHHNNKVEINNDGVYRDQPVQRLSDDVSVSHNNREVTISTGAAGVTIRCTMSRDQCMFKLRGSFYNSSFGLLGSNDGVSSNDFVLRSGTAAGSVQDFINYYELSGVASCRPSGSALSQTIMSCPSAASRQQCQNHFQASSSSLALCFDVVAPQPYLEACSHDADSCSHSGHPHKMCSSIQAYVNMCSVHGVSVQLPSTCVTCGSHSFGEHWHQQVHRKLDIVLATGLSADLAVSGKTHGQALNHVFHGIKNFLKNHANVRNIQAGLLGFGGQGDLEAPHVYTFQGVPFTRHYGSSIWNTQLNSLSLSGSNGDIQDAMSTILNYPFREDSVRIVVMFAGSSQLSQTWTSQMMSRVQSQQVILNVITREPQLLQSGSYSASNGNIVNLVSATGGRFFDFDEVTASSGHALQHLSHRLSQQISSTLQRCRDCQCELSAQGEPHTSCSSYMCHNAR